MNVLNMQWHEEEVVVRLPIYYLLFIIYSYLLTHIYLFIIYMALFIPMKYTSLSCLNSDNEFDWGTKRSGLMQSSLRNKELEP